jgi:hypothetical protein
MKYLDMKAKQLSSFNFNNTINCKLKRWHIDCKNIQSSSELIATIKARSSLGIKSEDTTV